MTRHRPADLLTVVSLVSYRADNNWGRRPFRQLDNVLRWMLEIAEAAEAQEDLSLLEDVAAPPLDCCGSWDQYRLYNPVRRWLRGLDEPAQTPSPGRSAAHRSRRIGYMTASSSTSTTPRYCTPSYTRPAGG